MALEVEVETEGTQMAEKPTRPEPTSRGLLGFNEVDSSFLLAMWC